VAHVNDHLLFIFFVLAPEYFSFVFDCLKLLLHENLAKDTFEPDLNLRVNT